MLPYFTEEEPRHREVKPLVQGHTESKGQSSGNPMSRVPPAAVSWHRAPHPRCVQLWELVVSAAVSVWCGEGIVLLSEKFLEMGLILAQSVSSCMTSAE